MSLLGQFGFAHDPDRTASSSQRLTTQGYRSSPARSHAPWQSAGLDPVLRYHDDAVDSLGEVDQTCALGARYVESQAQSFRLRISLHGSAPPRFLLHRDIASWLAFGRRGLSRSQRGCRA